MTKDDIVYFRDTVYKNKKQPLIIICDNTQLFYENVKDGFPLVWDDDNERLISIRYNDDHYAKGWAPYEIVVTEYEHIQYLKIHASVKDLIEFMNEFSGYTEDQKKEVNRLLSRSAGTTGYVTNVANEAE